MRTEGQTDMTKQIVAFRNLGTRLETAIIVLKVEGPPTVKKNLVARGLCTPELMYCLCQSLEYRVRINYYNMFSVV